MPTQSPATDLLPPEDLVTFSRLQLLAKQVVEGFCSGLHRSPHTGFSVEFKEHRSYVPGDDIRTIDWKLFGKTDRLFIREYEEETNLRCTLLLDCSGSMAYRGSRSAVSKHEYAVRTAAALSYLMLQQQDSVGLVTFDKAVRSHLPPRGTPRHLTAILNELEAQRPGDETDLGDVFREMVAKVSRRGFVIILSDLFGDVDRLMKSLAQFRHAHHEVVIFQIWDPDELDFPFKHWTEFTSLERPGAKHLVDPAQVRRDYLAKLSDFRDQLSNGCSRQRISLVPMTTDRPHADALAAHLAMRRKSA